ncbi:MAG: hypothetical protein WC745_00840 [Patescibacteria group bacterium]|jgi:hypothetical protein
MKNFLTLKYWFALNPGAPAQVMVNGLIGLTVLFFLIALILGMTKKRYRKNLYFRTLEKVYLFSLANFFLSLFFLFFVYESVPFFSSRFWFILWAGEMAAWLYFILKFLISLPEKRASLEKEREYNKYIP